MKYLVATVLLLGCGFILFAQKPPLDTAALAAWPRIGDAMISNDGNYVAYIIAVERRPPLLCIRSPNDGFKLDIPGGYQPRFTGDNKRLICMMFGDSLGIVDLVTRSIRYKTQVKSYGLPRDGNGRWLGYSLSSGELMLEDLFSGNRENYGLVADYVFSDKGKIMVLQGAASGGGRDLEWIDLEKGSRKRIYRGEGLSDLTFSAQEDGLAFFAVMGGGEKARHILCRYQAGEDSARVVVDESTVGMEAGYGVEPGEVEFAPQGNKLFFQLKRLPSITAGTPKGGVSVDIWNYKDTYLQCDQLADPEIDHLKSFEAVYNALSGRVFRLQQETDGFPKLNHGGNDNYLVNATKYNLSEAPFSRTDRSDLYVINTDDGTRICLAKRLYNPSYVDFSPGGRYVFWFDCATGAFYAYDLQKRVCHNITRKIPVSICDELDDLAGPNGPYGLATWLPEDSALLIYDHYDIWKVDPQGLRLPVNLTAGFGRKNRIVLRCVYDQNGLDRIALMLDEQGGLLLCALDEKSKANGFFQINYRGGTPEKLSMDDALYYFSGSSSWPSLPQEIRKASHTRRYLLQKMRVTEYPNWVLTEDFRSFRAVTHLHPEKAFNWLTGELVHWKTFSGHMGDGILYKPENFDPKRKYPIIFNYYERASDGLNNYLYPEFSGGSINIPWFVSRGYLVFRPDIRYSPGDPGAGVYDYVVSAAQTLAQKPWVDRYRMGIQGHSFGGFETNYLVTRTNIFAAAASAAGVSDMISESGDAGFAGGAGQPFVEFGQFRMAVPFWKNLDAYMRNSAVFQVKKIQTPLLIVHNRADLTVPWGQGVELFTALRRLGKPVWMLQYDGQGHTLQDAGSIDYSIRLTQFFDHYLKGGREPRWMSVGVPARWKGIDDGLEITENNSAAWK